MKTNLFFSVIAIIICSSVASAQNYFPFPVGSAMWQVTRCFYFYPPGWYDDHHIQMTGEDTVINNLTYKKLYFTNHHAPGSTFDTIYPKIYIGGMREVNKKIFVVSEYLCLDTSARCIYDFNASDIGDTLYTEQLTPGSYAVIPHLVTGIDSILIGTAYHRRLSLTDVNHNNFEQWTEGVGSSNGLIYASFWSVTDNSYDLICFSENNVNEYLNPSPSFGYCQAPLPPIECHDEASDILLIKDDWVNIYPNPAAAFVTVSFSKPEHISAIELSNLLGEKVLRKSASPNEYGTFFTIDLSPFPDGFYYLTLVVNDQARKTVRLIKKSKG